MGDRIFRAGLDPSPFRSCYGRMDTRSLIGYLLLALIAAILLGALVYATRERRAHYRAHRTARRRSRARIEDAADRS